MIDISVEEAIDCVQALDQTDLYYRNKALEYATIQKTDEAELYVERSKRYRAVSEDISHKIDSKLEGI